MGFDDGADAEPGVARGDVETVAAVEPTTGTRTDPTLESSPPSDAPGPGAETAPVDAPPRGAPAPAPAEPDRPTRFRLSTGCGLVADVAAVVLLWREGISTLAMALCFAAAVAGFDSVVSRPRSQRAWTLLVVALLTPVLVLTGVVDRVKEAVSAGPSLPSVDGGTWIHARPSGGGSLTRCTTAFAVEAGSSRYVVTARSCLPSGAATITTSDDPTGQHDRYTFARGVDCHVPAQRCLTADGSSVATDGDVPDVAAFAPDTAAPSAMLQAQENVATVPVVGSTTIDQVLLRSDRHACHFGLGSAEHGRQQPRQCGELVGMLPNGLGELDAYGNSQGDLGGPVYVSTPDGAAVYLLGMVVGAEGTCDLDGCHGRVLFLPVRFPR